jgi:UbiD family decarboxylase
VKKKQGMGMMQDLRSFITACEKRLPREFVRITKGVDPKYEITAIVKKVDLLGKSPMMVFDKVKGSTMSVVCNTDTDLNKFALAFGVTPDRVNDFYGEKEEEAMRLNKYACESPSLPLSHPPRK